MIGSTQAFEIGPAGCEDAPPLGELLAESKPSYWMRKVSPQGLATFAGYAAGSPRSVLLVARPKSPGPLAGYVLAVIDPRKFWLGFAVRRPALARTIFVHRLRRIFELERDLHAAAARGGGGETLPPFSWSPSRADAARVVGLFVRPEHEGKGVSMSLRFELDAALKKKGVATVEEYLHPGLSETAEKFFRLCGWDIRRCRKGYKLAKKL